MKKGKRARLAAVAAAVLVLASVLSPAAAAARDETVRVGFFPLGQFQCYGEDGGFDGYNAAYLDRLAGVIGWDVEYVSAQNWNEGLEMLEQGEIDLLAPAQMTQARWEQYLFSSYSMGVECGAIYAMEQRHGDIDFEDYGAIDGLLCGVMEGSPFTEQFTEYCEKHGIAPAVASYPNMTELLEALRGGEIDAAVTNIFFADDDLRLLGRFSLKPVYYITTPDKSDLMDELNEGLGELLAVEPEFQTSLENQYFDLFSSIELTYEEREFVADCPVLKVGYEVNKMPLSYTDSDGEFAGITRDILDRISEISGLRFEFVPLPESTVSYQYLLENDISITCNVENNSINTSLDTMRMSKPYLSSEKVFVSLPSLEFDNDSSLTLALSTGSTTLEKVLEGVYPNYSPLRCADAEGCFDAVRSGKADLLMLNRYVAERLLSKPAYHGMEIMAVQGLADELCLGVMSFGSAGDAWNRELFNSPFISIVDKAINQLTTKEVDAIIIRNAGECVYQLTPGDAAYQYRYALGAAALAAAIVAGLLWWVAAVRKRSLTVITEKNRLLGEAVEQANAANRTKGTFLAQMSHEIRTPMNAIIGMTELAAGVEENPPKTQTYLEKIGAASRILLNLINDVLDMSAIEGGKMKIAQAPFDIKSLLEGISNVYYLQCQEKGVRFELYTEQLTDETFVGDSLRVNQILLNLVSNAYKFTDAGGSITITVSQTDQHREKLSYLKFIVEDTGCGMSEEMQSRLFRPFEQESAATARKHGGSGLGLAITKNLVTMMKGAITVESHEGVGTKFTVELPFQRAGDHRRLDAAALKGMPVLVIDDDEKTLEYTRSILERMGLRCDTASSGQEGVALLKAALDRNERYDVCLVDWKMSGMGGVETTREIRRLAGSAPLVIIVSAYDLSEIMDEATAAGADQFISKPLFQSALFNALMNVRGGRGQQTAQPAQPAYDFTGRRILLAEDFDLNREVATDILEAVNVQVDCAENGREAVEMFTAAPAGTYDLILMDIQMPEMDGYEATKAIRESGHAQADIPIFAMTANAFTEDVSAALSAGMNGHIAKPIDTALLYEILAQRFNKGE